MGDIVRSTIPLSDTEFTIDGGANWQAVPSDGKIGPFDKAVVVSLRGRIWDGGYVYSGERTGLLAAQHIQLRREKSEVELLLESEACLLGLAPEGGPYPWPENLHEADILEKYILREYKARLERAGDGV